METKTEVDLDRLFAAVKAAFDEQRGAPFDASPPGSPPAGPPLRAGHRKG